MVRTLFSPQPLYAGVSKRVLLYSRCICSHASFSTCFKASSFSDFTGSQLLETRHAITSCLEATRRCDAAPVVSSRSLGWVIPKPGKVGFESCRLVHAACVIFGRRGTVDFFWRERGRRIVMDSNEHVGGRRGSGFTPATGSTGTAREHLICR